MLWCFGFLDNLLDICITILQLKALLKKSCVQPSQSVLVAAASLTSFSTLVVPNCIFGFGAGSEHTASNISRHLLDIMALWCTVDMVVVPHLTELSPAIVVGAGASNCLVVPRPRATYIRHEAVFFCQSLLDV